MKKSILVWKAFVPIQQTTICRAALRSLHISVMLGMVGNHSFNYLYGEEHAG
jgi:hypothetical protein